SPDPQKVGPERAERQLAQAEALLASLFALTQAEPDPVRATAGQLYLDSEARKHLRLQQCRLRFARGDVDGALAQGREVARDYAASPRVYETLTGFLEASGRDLERVEFLQEALHTFPRFWKEAQLLQHLYEALAKTGRAAEQDLVAERLCEVSDNPWFFLHTCRARERGPYAEAKARYDALSARVAAGDAPLELRLRRARLAYLLGLDGFYLAKALLDEELVRDPACLEALLLRGEIALLHGNADPCLSLAERALRLAPDLAQAELLLARARFGKQRHAKAIASAERVLRLDPSPTEEALALVVLAAALRETRPFGELSELLERMEASTEPYLRTVSRLYVKWEAERLRNAESR
ncbi:MAG: hypothetical protein KDD82_18385, partial [Planctomycetes bacterium]|nr:hypothetical protein [Planctomycetota bacterium]